MTERDLERACMGAMSATLPGAFVWKISDRVRGGLPDLEVSWAGFTTKIEFKLLTPGEDIHKKWEDARQLITCVELERATSRCWVVAFVKANRKSFTLPETRVYRPSALEHGACPIIEDFDDANPFRYRLLWERGVIRLRGFNHPALVELIRFTHRCER